MQHLQCQILLFVHDLIYRHFVIDSKSVLRKLHHNAWLRRARGGQKLDTSN